MEQEKMFRSLKADEIDVRVAMCNEKGCSLLLYKDARIDQKMLDEKFGPFGWQRKHELIGDRLYCTISVYDDKTQQWVSKQDVGTESYTEKEKGQASDSFKRAAFNWGIGRELYTSPFIWIDSAKCKIEQKKGKWVCSDKFIVEQIIVEDGKIVALSIKNAKSKQRVFLVDNRTNK